MRRSTRLFEIIQILRASQKPTPAASLADALEVSVRTVYRDIAALQSMRTPIEGEPGLGYIIRKGYDLPPLNFDQEEAEALFVGLSLLARTGDGDLQRAARRISEKIDVLRNPTDWLSVAPWGAPLDDPELGCVSKAVLREAIRSEQKLKLTYRSADGNETERVIRPLALVYHVECVLLAGWCELRGAIRHFRTERIYACERLPERFEGQSATLREIWREQNPWGPAAQSV